jgi:hypothetical protein
MDESGQRPRSAMRPMRLVNILARLRPGMAEEQLQAQLPQLTASIRAEYPKDFEKAGFLDGMRILATPLQRRITGDLRPALVVLSGAVLLVLLIACANLANLLLARGASREREMAVRMRSARVRRGWCGRRSRRACYWPSPAGSPASPWLGSPSRC